jgi:hypothetical protein
VPSPKSQSYELTAAMFVAVVFVVKTVVLPRHVLAQLKSTPGFGFIITVFERVSGQPDAFSTKKLAKNSIKQKDFISIAAI